MAVTGAGAGDVGVVIVDPQGRRDTVEVMLEDKGDSTFRCTYRPVQQGPHLVHVTYAGAQIPRSPYTVNVAEGESGPPNCPQGPPNCPLWHHGGPTAPQCHHGPSMFLGTFWDCLVPRCPHAALRMSLVSPWHLLVPRVSPQPPYGHRDPVAPSCPQGVPMDPPNVLGVPIAPHCPQGVPMAPW